MYIPNTNLTTDRDEIISFMRRFSFATIITAREDVPLATHLPFLISQKNDTIFLTSHFAKANKHWKDIKEKKVLVIFSEPHAYISPKNYEHHQNVPTWNYISIHAYGRGNVITDSVKTTKILEATIDTYETSYRKQWDSLSDVYKIKMTKGIVAFEVEVTDLQGKKKLSQNKTEKEQQSIITSLAKSEDCNEKLIADYMRIKTRSNK